MYLIVFLKNITNIKVFLNKTQTFGKIKKLFFKNLKIVCSVS